ncbi:MAG: type VI secretion system protein TssA [Gammaproteobacteria bacterium]|nr:type VI secretion system protein TssA [Gammaproteobacteria bacterium]
MDNLDPRWNKLGTQPISESAPVGEKANYEPEFEDLQTEIEKLQTNPSEVDWQRVVDNGAIILEQKSKDLLVASRFCLGLQMVFGIQGAVVGLVVIRDLMASSFWDTLYPKRLVARGAALGWLSERLTKSFQGTDTPSPEDTEVIKQGFQAIDDIDRLCGDLLGDNAPSFHEPKSYFRESRDDLLRRQQEEVLRKEEEEKRRLEANAEPPQAPAEKSPPQQAPATTIAATAQAVVDVNAIPKALRVTKETLRNIAEFLRAKKLADPRPYQLLRTGVWLEIEQLPPGQNGRTQIPEMPIERIQFLQGLLQNREFTNLINEVEKSFYNSPFWLDAHLLIANALEQMGPEYTDTRQAVIHGLADFLNRFPGVLEMQFASGKGFADELTRTWIDSEVKGAAVGPDGSSGQESGGAAPWQEVASEARVLAVKGKFKEGVVLFQQGLRSTFGMRERFFWELEQARYCMDSGYNDIAVAQLDFLEQQVQRYLLEEWEPGIALEVARLSLMCYQKTAQTQQLSPEQAGKLENLSKRVCRLDISSAVDLVQNNSA